MAQLPTMDVQLNTEQVQQIIDKLTEVKQLMEGLHITVKPTSLTTSDLTPYAMTIKNEAEAERALAAARKLGYEIDRDTRYKFKERKKYFIAYKDKIDAGFYIHSGVESTPITLEDFEKLAGITYDPLEGKQVEGFFIGGVGTGLNYKDQQLFMHDSKLVYCMCPASNHNVPHHLTRVTERTVGRFYLIQGCSGDKPQDFGLYLGGKTVEWIIDPELPIFVCEEVERISMYEVTPTL